VEAVIDRHNAERFVAPFNYPTDRGPYLTGTNGLSDVFWAVSLGQTWSVSLLDSVLGSGPMHVILQICGRTGIVLPVQTVLDIGLAITPMSNATMALKMKDRVKVLAMLGDAFLKLMSAGCVLAVDGSPDIANSLYQVHANATMMQNPGLETLRLSLTRYGHGGSTVAIPRVIEAIVGAISLGCSAYCTTLFCQECLLLPKLSGGLDRPVESGQVELYRFLQN